MQVTASNMIANILLVEDNPGDIRLVREALKESKIETQLKAFQSGEEALQYLNQSSQNPSLAFPDLIMLDLNLPRKSGHEILKEIKNAQDIKHVPVVIFSTSQDKNEILQLYQNHASCYIVKPADFESYIDAIKKIEEFWLNTVHLPMEAS